MSVISKNGKVLIGENGKAASFDSLVQQANQVTGQDDKTVGEQVESLIDGYGADTLNLFLQNSMEHIRITTDFPKGSIAPGGSGKQRIPGIKYIELINYTQTLDVWNWANITNLERFDAGYTDRLDNVCLYGNNNLMSLILRKSDALVTIYSTNSLLMNQNGKIYVPKDMIEAYKQATIWTNFANKFAPLYIAQSVQEKEVMLVNPNIQDGSMIVCDIEQSYTIKGQL